MAFQLVERSVPALLVAAASLQPFPAELNRIPAIVGAGNGCRYLACACSYRRTGVHFAGTCDSVPSSLQSYDNSPSRNAPGCRDDVGDRPIVAGRHHVRASDAANLRNLFEQLRADPLAF